MFHVGKVNKEETCSQLLMLILILTAHLDFEVPLSFEENSMNIYRKIIDIKGCRGNF